MWAIRTCCVVSILAIFGVPHALSSENSLMSKQVAAIVKFFEIMVADTQPKASDFFKLFGKENESELKLILSQEFPGLDIKQTWFLEKEALKYVNRVYDNPTQYDSRFLECLRKARPDLFRSKAKRQIEFPPEITKSFSNFKITVSGKTAIFQFSAQEVFIENI